MSANPSGRGAPELLTRDRSVAQIAAQEQVTQLLAELSILLEEYAPAWYPQELQNRVEQTLRSLQK